VYKFCSELQGFGALNRHERIAVITHFVEGFAIADTGYLRTHRDIPPLYDSGVYYCRDDNGREVQWWDIPSIRSNRCADCKGLAAWRIGELRLAGYPANPLVVTRDGSLFHVLVQSGSIIEDPSARLGMH
jgi:hypothetical protein